MIATCFRLRLYNVNNYCSYGSRLYHKINKDADSSVNNVEEMKDVFTSTRVFVQGIPEEVTWMELKDHFKNSGGNVVYASISIDTATKKSKGCGIVQYETSDEATEARNIMGNFPLKGSKLFVREDYQEKRSTGKYTSVWKLGLRKTPRSVEDREKSLVEKNLAKKSKTPRIDQPRKDGMIKNKDGTLTPRAVTTEPVLQQQSPTPSLSSNTTNTQDAISPISSNTVVNKKVIQSSSSSPSSAAIVLNKSEKTQNDIKKTKRVTTSASSSVVTKSNKGTEKSEKTEKTENSDKNSIRSKRVSKKPISNKDKSETQPKTTNLNDAQDLANQII